MKYANGLATQKQIIEVCKRLFYEKGIEGTTYTDICAAADVHPGTLTHHFSEKANIASEIYLKASLALDMEITELFAEEDRAQQLLIAVYVHLLAMYQDAAYARFYIEYMALDIHYGIYMKHLPDIMRDISCKEGEEDSASQERMTFRAVAYRGMQAALIYYINARHDTIPVELAFGYWGKFFLLIQEIQGDAAQERIDRVLKQSRGLEIKIDGLNVHIRFPNKGKKKS